MPRLLSPQDDRASGTLRDGARAASQVLPTYPGIGSGCGHAVFTCCRCAGRHFSALSIRLVPRRYESESCSREFRLYTICYDPDFVDEVNLVSRWIDEALVIGRDKYGVSEPTRRGRPLHTTVFSASWSDGLHTHRLCSECLLR